MHIVKFLAIVNFFKRKHPDQHFSIIYKLKMLFDVEGTLLITLAFETLLNFSSL